MTITSAKTPELILLIDDSDDDNYIHQRVISRSGLACQVDICESGDVAMDYLTNQGKYNSRGTDYPVPDLVFLDINMPRVNGWEFLDLYANWVVDAGSMTPEQLSVIIVMLSTSNNPSDKERADASRFVSDYIIKPLEPDTLIEVVKRHFPHAYDR